MMTDLDPHQLALLAAAHAAANADLDTFVADQRATLARFGPYEAAARFQLELDQMHPHVILGVAVMAVTRLAQQPEVLHD